MIKLFATDLDGTFMNADHTTDEYILQGVGKLHDQGYILAAATGRAFSMTPQEELPGFYVVCMNGAYTAAPDGTVLASHPIDPAVIQEMYEKFPDMPLEFNAENCIYCHHDRKTAEALDLKYRGPGSGLIPPKGLSRLVNSRVYSASLSDVLSEPIYKVNCMHIGGEEEARFEAWLKEHTQNLCNAQSLPSLYELTRAGITKATGVHDLAAWLHILPAETAVFGDGGNDLAMLSAFEASYAPANASNAARKAARYSIDPNTDYSVIDEMCRIASQQGPVRPTSD